MTMDYKKLTDEELIEGFRIDQPYAYKALYYNRTQQFRGYLAKQGATDNQIDEIEQDTILDFYENMISGKYTYNGSAKISTYLYSIARFKWLKLRGKNSAIDLNIDIPDGYEEENEIDNQEIFQIVMTCMKQLTERCQKTLVGFHYEGKSFEEIAESLPDVTADNIRKNKPKCLKKLKSLVKEKIN